MKRVFLGTIDFYGKEVEAYREIYATGKYKFVLEEQGNRIYSFSY